MSDGTEISRTAVDDVASLQRKLKTAEKERDIYYFQVKEIEDDRNKQVQALQRTVTEVEERRNALQERIDRVDRIENTIIDLFLEMKDRSTEAADAVVDVDKERLELKKKNPLVVLDMLRASLRVLLGFKDDFEDELRGRLDRRKGEVEESRDRLERENAELVGALEAARQAQEAAEKALGAEREEHDTALRQSEEVVRNIRQDNVEVSRIVAEREKKVTELQAALESKDRVIGEKDLRLMRVSQLESQLMVNKMQNKFDLAKVQASHVTSLKTYAGEVRKFSRTEASLEAAQAEIAMLKQQVHSYRTNLNTKKIADSEKKVSELTRQAERLKQVVAGKEKELRSAKYVAETSQQKMGELKTEYDKLYQAVEAQRRADARRQTKKRAIMKTKAEANPFYVEIYKARLKEKEQEVEELSGKVRRLLAGQHRSTMVQRAHQAERRNLETELAEMRSASAGGIRQIDQNGDDLAQLVERNTELEAKVRDYVNIKAIGQTTAKAYQQLVETQASGRRAVTPSDRSALPPRASTAMGTRSTGLSHQLPLTPMQDLTLTPGRPGSSLAATGPTPDFSMSRAERRGRGGSRPMSAVTGRSLNGVGSSHSTLRPGSLMM